jgi:glucose/arabinose dehydrogenase/mono/diheme cytochrome c family protein
MRNRILIALILSVCTAKAQRGDKREHHSMDPVVPENLIPPSPVLSVDEALETFEVAPGFVIEAVAAEPLVDKPVALDFDPAGRMWICEMRGYMPDIDGKGESNPEGRIVILEDTTGDGKADKRTVFLDEILMPRSIAVFEEGVLFLDQSRLCWVKRNGDQPAGEPEVIDTRLASGGNVEHKINGLLPNLDNRYYLAKSDRRLHRENGEWKYERTSNRGQWGIARDDYGRLYHNNNSRMLFADLLAPNLLQGNPGVRMPYQERIKLGSDRVWPIRVTPGLNRAYLARSNGYDSNLLDPRTHKLINATAAAGMAIYRGTNFPSEWYGTGFITESSVNLVKAIRIEEEDGKLEGSHPLGEKEFLASTDERFRPVNIYNAPDGSLYLLDMYHGIIQHRTFMTSYLREQTLDRGLEGPAFGHGRIYRLRSTKGSLEPHQNIASLAGLELVKVLMHPNAWHRETAQRLLVERANPATIPHLATLADGGSPVARIHAIWSLEGMGALEAEHLAPALGGREEDSKVVASALWASTRLSPVERAKLQSMLTGLSVGSEEVAPYLARALGPLGTPDAFAALAKLLDRHERTPFVREAAVSGLDGHEVAFLEGPMKDSTDRDFVNWLREGSRDARKPERSSGARFKGRQLAAYERGKALFLGEAACFACHGTDGAGMDSLGPPLDGSEWVNGEPEILVKILLHGVTGPISVGGETYETTAEMPGLAMNPAMTDQRLSEIATYVRNEWSNEAAPVPISFISKIREQTQDRAGAYTAAELSP